jgi:hypothetical protein
MNSHKAKGKQEKETGEIMNNALNCQIRLALVMQF